MAGPRRNSDAPPPSYTDTSSSSNAVKLRESFATLVNDQLEIQNLFKSVACQLETTPQLGEHHPLAEEWNTLRQSSMAIKDKKIMIDKFLEAITVHQDTARRVATKFHELGKDVERFQLKVASALRCQAEPSGFLQSIWSGLEEICMTIWQTLHKLLRAMVDTFRSMLSRIRTIRIHCVVRVDIEFSQYSHLPSDMQDDSPRATAARVRADCKELTDQLSGFEDAWHTVRLSCADLLINLAMAKSMTSIHAVFDANVRSAGIIYTPLVECLRAYSLGRAPGP
ncbi:hypothetical protein IEO21_06626 [Rhodonia placenta]|uniref:Uncharacterized protein n=1 Tax=Rhodonia placenta TaxID=104341 RepID=A0A8H7U0Z8_9APHY|nr:hypothetical protein IEO21_06626 [Postia placenta]